LEFVIITIPSHAIVIVFKLSNASKRGFFEELPISVVSVLIISIPLEEPPESTTTFDSLYEEAKTLYKGTIEDDPPALITFRFVLTRDKRRISVRNALIIVKRIVASFSLRFIAIILP
jgi:hypothetical protein